jgi:hypothetical protein
MLEITLPVIPAPSRLPELIRLCKASVTLEANDHRSCYQTVQQFMEDEEGAEVEPDVMQKMIDTDTIIRLQFYPLTPIGFYVIYHYDVDLAVQQALTILKEKHDQRK